jgi:multidrug efflux pump subunit AcrA (membrane-fusion protein)
MGKGKIIKILVVAVVFTVVAVGLKKIYLAPKIVESFNIVPQKYEEKILSVGNLNLENETSLKSKVSGIIKYIAVEEGGKLNEGDTLIEIDDVDQALLIEQKKANYLDLQAQYNNLVNFEYLTAEQELSRISSLLSQAEKSYEDSINLYEEGAISENSMIEFKTNYENLSVQWQQADLKKESLGEGGFLRSSALSKLNGAKASLESEKEVSKNYTISVPWNSILLKSYVKTEEYVQVGQILADIGELGNFIVTTELDEKYYTYIKKGMKVSISVSGQEKAGDSLGEIIGITPKINEDTGTFEVRISLPADFPYEASNLTVNVEIHLREIDDAITIPTKYVVEADDSYVLLFNEGKVEKKKVEIEKNNSSSIVLKGLIEGDIIVDPSYNLEDGDIIQLSEEEVLR